MRHDLMILEQRWGMALQTAGFGVWDLDTQRDEVHYSPEWKAMLVYEASDAPHSTATWRSRVHPDDLQPMLDALLAHLDGRRAMYEHEFRLRAADGWYRWVMSRGRVVERDARGRALRMIGTLTDISDRRQAEALRQARDRAEAANRAKTEFLARMSHELRTPLNAVLGFAQLLAQRLGGPGLDEQRRHVDHIEKAGWQLLNLIDDVLDLQRAEEGHLPLVLQPVALAPLLRAAVAAVAASAAPRGIVLDTAALRGDAVVIADPERLGQVFANLLSNAIKYNRDAGRVSLLVTPQGDAWQVAVCDSGVGIPAAQMPHLFEPFNRLGRAGGGERSGEGVGVGLTLSRWLVQKMGGELVASSTEGRGSTFAVRLPVAPAG
jgi:PAS domain S-box-containing protein